MRLRTVIWVHAYLRRCASEGIPAAVVRHGDDDAGAVFIKINRLDGSCQLLTPAPAGLEDAAYGRRWTAETAAAEAAVEARLARERDIDSDHWVIEVEDRKGRHFLHGELAPAG